jgi:hypothetical protein
MRTELVAVILEHPDGRDEIRFVPTCAGCGILVLDPTIANTAVVEGDGELKAAGTHLGARVSRLEGTAVVFCWACDEKQERNNVPWANAANTFRDRNDAAQQRLEPVFRSASTRGGAR